MVHQLLKMMCGAVVLHCANTTLLSHLGVCQSSAHRNRKLFRTTDKLLSSCMQVQESQEGQAHQAARSMKWLQLPALKEATSSAALGRTEAGSKMRL